MTEYPVPTEPGWYRRWRKSTGDGVVVDIVWVDFNWIDGKRLGIYRDGLFQPVDDPRSWWRWGPRVPDWTPSENPS